MVITLPKSCVKCGHKVKAKWCQGAPTGIRFGRTVVGSLITNDGSYGFVCKTAGEHFHYYCHSCGYAEH